MSGCGYDACRECGRASFMLTLDGWCARCDAIVSAQARAGLVELDAYLAKVAAFQAWCVCHRVAA